MCLAVPMRIVSIDGHLACRGARGVRREVSLTLLGDGAVQIGYARQVIADENTKATWDLFDEIAGHARHG